MTKKQKVHNTKLYRQIYNYFEELADTESHRKKVKHGSQRRTGCDGKPIGDSGRGKG